MKKYVHLLSLSFLIFIFSCKKIEYFPVSEWNSNSDKPVIFYISGDGGFNSFSKTLSKELHRNGYDVFALNTKKYFWKKKTPLQVSQDTESFLKEVTKDRKNKKIIIVGYSYGAEVAPFIFNRFDEDFQKNIQDLMIIGPTKFNDFEIHLEEYVAERPETGYNVIHEINQLKNIRFTLVVSDIENEDFPKNEITLKNYQFLHINGNHHFSGNTKMLADSIVKHF